MQFPIYYCFVASDIASSKPMSMTAVIDLATKLDAQLSVAIGALQISAPNILSSGLVDGLNSKLTILAVHQYLVGRKVTIDVQSQEDVDQLLRNSRYAALSFGLHDVTAVELKSRDVAHAIVDYAEKNGIELIVMGAAGLGNIKSFVIGSVSADVLRKSVCPVTIVH